MEIVVNDTNILIDLYNSKLLEHCQLLGFDFRTLDLVIAEIEDEAELIAIKKNIDNGILKVYSLDGLQMMTVVQNKYDNQDKCNLSIEDFAVMQYAKDNNCRLLTGDKKLRKTAEKNNVKVSGILYIIDNLIGKIDNQKLIESLELLLQSNDRLPKKDILERIDTLKLL